MAKFDIAVTDDQVMFRKGLVSLLSEFPELKVVIEADNGKDLQSKMKRRIPDVVLLDLEMPVMDGMETMAWLKATHPGIRVIILTMHNEEPIIAHMIENGAHGFLVKNDPIETLIDAIHSVMDTGYYFDDRVSRALLQRLVLGEKVKPNFAKVALSERETQVIQLICMELTNHEIADRMNISVRTVEGHREVILEKLKARNTVGIVMYAIKNGLYI
jgi:two-component system, NarL family, response regulator DegU